MSRFASIRRSLDRQIAQRTRGQGHGPITRLMSPSDFGQILKPFVFLDLFDNHGVPFEGFGLHPHSGIATLTYLAEGSVSYEDTTGATGVLPAGGVEWMRGGGSAHRPLGRHGFGRGGGPRRAAAGRPGGLRALERRDRIQGSLRRGVRP